LSKPPALYKSQRPAHPAQNTHLAQNYYSYQIANLNEKLLQAKTDKWPKTGLLSRLKLAIS
ncbi:MAG: hypothetical protein VX438_00725, partial [Planctomycetota bacterium]|nr:hypothetical protein [Planctomycetota bacterium]